MNFKTGSKDIYLIRATLNDGTFQYKIGVSKHVNKRLMQNKTSNPNDLQVLCTFHSEHPYLVETSLKNHFKLKQISGEWFDLTQLDVDEFVKLCEKIDQNFKTIRDNSTLYS